MDAKDILGLPKNSLPSSQERRPRPPKEPHRKPDGISREVYALTGGLAPLMPTVEASHLKRRPTNAEKEKITWQWLSFTSSARSDNLQLYHWVRVVNGVPPTGDYSFAKYNKSVDVLKYTDEEYEKHLTDPTWAKEETDQLFDLCERFDLRFVVIADRFPTPRSVEELKSRYYAVSRALLIARAPSSGDVSRHPLVKESYNISHEIERKRALSAVLSQTKQQEHRDAEILAEAKRIMELRMANKSIEDVELPINPSGIESIDKAAPAESVSPSSNIQPSSSTAAATATTESPSTPASLRVLRVYLRSHALDQMVQALSTTAGLRTTKRVDQTLQDLGVHLKPKVTTKSVCAEHLELRKEIMTLLNLQKQLQNKDVEASANRENLYTEMPGSPKRAYRGDIDRPFIPESLGYGVEGERMGKRDHKRKVAGRLNDVPPSPPQYKRPRKLKASD